MPHPRHYGGQHPPAQLGCYGEVPHTVPVEAAYQVWRVPKVLSMGKVCTYVQSVTEKSCQIKPWENFEKMQF